jgi:multicomponent Na+:H+ antiporter subunit F
MNASIIFQITGLALLVLSIICVIRILTEKRTPDKLVALDTMNTIIVGLLMVLSAAFNAIIYVDIAIVYALLSVVSTVYLASYLRGEKT